MKRRAPRPRPRSSRPGARSSRPRRCRPRRARRWSGRGRWSRPATPPRSPWNSASRPPTGPMGGSPPRRRGSRWLRPISPPRRRRGARSRSGVPAPRSARPNPASSAAARPASAPPASAVGEPLFRLIARGEIELEGEVPETALPRLHPGAPARLELEDGRAIPGAVRRVYPRSTARRGSARSASAWSRTRLCISAPSPAAGSRWPGAPASRCRSPPCSTPPTVRPPCSS